MFSWTVLQPKNKSQCIIGLTNLGAFSAGQSTELKRTPTKSHWFSTGSPLREWGAGKMPQALKVEMV